MADVLVGLAEPSGRLAETLPRRIEDTSAFGNFPGEVGSVRYGEGVLVGYRWHVTADVPARYPFGHGLGYCDVETTELRVVEVGGDTARIEVTVRNLRERPIDHVVQVYVATSAGPVTHPLRELRAFDKVALAPHQTRSVTFELDRRAFAYWDVRYHRWVVPRGTYRVQVCQDAETVITEAIVALAGDVLVPHLEMSSPIGLWISLDPPVSVVFGAGRDARMSF